MKEALALVNAARGALGLAPLGAFPKGARFDNHECSLARSLTGTSVAPSFAVLPREYARAVAEAWGTTVRSEHEDRAVVGLPPALVDFVRFFDAGLYPELVEEASA